MVNRSPWGIKAIPWGNLRFFIIFFPLIFFNNSKNIFLYFYFFNIEFFAAFSWQSIKIHFYGMALVFAHAKAWPKITYGFWRASL